MDFTRDSIFDAKEKWLLHSVNQQTCDARYFDYIVSTHFPYQCSYRTRKELSKNLVTDETAPPLGRIVYNLNHDQRITILSGVTAVDFGASSGHYPRKDGLPRDIWAHRVGWIWGVLEHLEEIVPKGEAVAVGFDFACASERHLREEVHEILLTHSQNTGRRFVVYGCYDPEEKKAEEEREKAEREKKEAAGAAGWRKYPDAEHRPATTTRQFTKQMTRGGGGGGGYGGNQYNNKKKDFNLCHPRY